MQYVHVLAQCAVHTPLLGPDVKYAQLAGIHTHAGAGECADQCMSYRTGVQPTLAIPDMQKVSTNHGSPDFAYTKSLHGLGEAGVIKPSQQIRLNLHRDFSNCENLNII